MMAGNCCPAGHKLEAAQVGVSGPGEVLRGSMARDAHGRYATTPRPVNLVLPVSSRALCNLATSRRYVVTSANGHGEASVLISDDTASGLVTTWDWVDLVLETYDVADCAQYSAGRAASLSAMTLVDVSGAPVTPRFERMPYINGHYLPPAEAKAFAACCRGQFDIHWPSASMAHNGGGGEP